MFRATVPGLADYARPMPDSEIDHRAPEPPYRQIAAVLAAEIAEGKWQPNTPLDPEKAMCARFGVARNTVRNAYQILIADGLIYTVPHRGTYVAERPAPDTK